MVDQVLFVWNDVTVEPPDFPDDLGVPVQMVLPKASSVNNRYRTELN